MRTNTQRRMKIATTFVVMLLATTLTTLLMPHSAATPTSITSITPERGNVGDTCARAEINEPKFLCQVQTRNLDNEIVSGISVDSFAHTGVHDVSPLVTKVSDNEGLTEFLLEAGNYSFRALLNNVEVGNVPVFSLSENSTKILKCQLAHIRTSIKNVNETALPFIGVTIIYDYTTIDNETILEEDSLETNSTGIAVLPNTFTNISYVIEMRRYNHLFSTKTIGNLNASLWVNATCPAYPLFIHVVDSKNHPLQNVRVTISEWSREPPILTQDTNETGNIASELTFGRYKIIVRKHSTDFNEMIVLNKTIINLIEDQFLVIYCEIFGIELSVRVVDYFGQPIPDAMVDIERRSEQGWMKIEPSIKTDSEGVVSLPNIGGDYMISIYAIGNPDSTRTIGLTTSQQRVFKLDKYFVVGGYLIGTSQFVTYISLVLLVVVFCSYLMHKKYIQERVTKEYISEEKSR